MAPALDTETEVIEPLEDVSFAVAQGDARSILPFTFAKQFGVLLDTAGEHPVIVHQGVPRATVLAERPSA